MSLVKVKRDWASLAIGHMNRHRHPNRRDRQDRRAIKSLRSPRTPRFVVDTCASIPTLSRKSLPPALWIFLTALAVRLVHVWQMRGSPFFSVLLGDSRGYDEWARRIAGGEWIGTDGFYQAPLYPYMLGAIYAVAGRHLLLVRVVQAVIGSLSCVFLALATERFVSPRASVAPGPMPAPYRPALLFT